jgi:Family of unknown function (DUF5681)
MSEENMSDSYEVGYGKPPKDTQFKKGSSGNPKGRPKKALDFDLELLRQSKAIIVINENGRPRRISKHEAVSMQLINKAASGYIPALRTYVDRYERALEKAALLEAKRSHDRIKRPLSSMTDDELDELYEEAKKAEEWETKRGHIPNAD